MTKANLELNLATAFKENKKSFFKYIDRKSRAKERFHPLLDAERSSVSGNKNKAVVPSLLQCLMPKPTRILSSQSWKLEW